MSEPPGVATPTPAGPGAFRARRTLDPMPDLRPAADGSLGGTVDLHLHSTHSDGSHAPAELVPMALAAGVAAIALTDHDEVSGLPELRQAAAGTGLEIVTGVELSASSEKSDLHILGYFIDDQDPKLLAALLEFRAGRRQRAESIVAKLNGLGLEITVEDVLRQAGGASLGRPHVAQALLELGHVDTFDDAFRHYLGHHARAFVPKPHLAPERAIELIRNAGGVAVFAHPGTANRDDLIPGLAAAGLSGIEVWHPKHTASQVHHYRRVAERHHLTPSGGSDFHGASLGPFKIGASRVPASVLEALRARR